LPATTPTATPWSGTPFVPTPNPGGAPTAMPAGPGTPTPTPFG
jgi:hypothetical protein